MTRTRILITGFGPFPGAPFNPTMPLVARLTGLRRPALDDIELTSHIFHVTCRTIDRELPKLIAKVPPDAMLMFGLASRGAHVRIESRARNAVTTTFPDADRSVARKGSIVEGAAAMAFGPHTAKLLRAAQATKRPSGPRLAAFVHIPLLGRNGAARRQGASRITLEELVDAGEAMLMELVRLTRQEASTRSRGLASSIDGGISR